jgi:hypothetical protein
MGINFFFTFPTSEGSDLLSSHVMQTPTFISKLSDGNVIFRLDVGKNRFFNLHWENFKITLFVTDCLLGPVHKHTKVSRARRKVKNE